MAVPLEAFVMFRELNFVLLRIVRRECRQNLFR
ncbi:Uncharacterised protein [Vibrio cholerae]|nr:Uncharacterised protein [Vibrio cholerae]